MNENYEGQTYAYKSGEEIEKPWLLKAIEPILADPADIIVSAGKLYRRVHEKHKYQKSDDEIRRIAAKKIVSNYSYYAAFTGGATALTGVVPGLGTVVATFGGAAADTALLMKYQIEMIMALATIFGHDIEKEEEKRICLLVAGLGAASKTATDSGRAIGSKAFIKIVQDNLKGATLVTVKQVFRKVGITFTRKGLEKAIPFGVGVVIGTATNKALTVYVGSKACDFFEVAK